MGLCPPQGVLTAGAPFPAPQQLCPSCRAAVLAGVPEELDPPKTLPSHPARAGGATARTGWRQDSFVELEQLRARPRALYLCAERASSVPVTGRRWIIIPPAAK